MYAQAYGGQEEKEEERGDRRPIGIGARRGGGAAAAYWFVSGKYSRISYKVTFNDEIVASCDNAEITELFPKNGGYRFHCGNEASVYVVYSTGRGAPVDGTIIEVNAIDREAVGDNRDRMFQVAYDAGGGQDFDCPAAKAPNRKGGEEPFPKTLFGDIEKGTYAMTIAKPCGKLVLEIGKPISSR